MSRDHRKYRIREVDTSLESVIEVLSDLHHLTFRDAAPLPVFDAGHWWIASQNGRPIAFAGLVASTVLRESGYFCRVGVVKGHLGRGLQRRLMRVLERRGRRNAWRCIISDTTDNLFSANNFIQAGYRLFQPTLPWGWSHTLYWHKPLRSLKDEYPR